MHQNVNNFVSKYLSKGLVENVCVCARVCVCVCVYANSKRKKEWEREEINMANVDDYWI